MADTAEALLRLPPLAVGHHVRIRLSGECPGLWWKFQGRYEPHRLDDDRCVGVVMALAADHDDCGAPGGCGHDYYVVFDGWPDWGSYARVELEQVT